MSLLHAMAACGRVAFWWLCLRRWMGGGRGHPSYHHALFIDRSGYYDPHVAMQANY
jgi:hypothetical protein